MTAPACARMRLSEPDHAPAPAAFTATHRLPAVPPFEFHKSLQFLAHFSPTAGEQAVEGGVLTKALRADGMTVAVRVRASHPGCVDIELSSAAARTRQTDEAALDRIGFLLSLQDDLNELYARSTGDAAFAAVATRLHGYHQVKFSSPWENVAWAVLSQRSPRTTAVRIKNALTTAGGNLIEIEGRPFGAFPDAAQLATWDLADVVSCVGNVRKADYLHRCAQAWLGLDEQFLRTAPYAQAQEQLLALPGIGPWSSAFVLIRGLGRMEQAAPDKELLRAAARVYGHPVDERCLAQLASRYGPLQGYWAHYLRAGG